MRSYGYPSGLITRHSKSVRSYRLILSLNQSSARYESYQSANAPFSPFIDKLGVPVNDPWRRSATRDKTARSVERVMSACA
jgi:hypothetical protein